MDDRCPSRACSPVVRKQFRDALACSSKSFIRQCISDGTGRETTVMEVESASFQVVRVRHCD